MNIKPFNYKLSEVLSSNPEINLEMDEYNINVTSNYGEQISSKKLREYVSNQSPIKNSPIHLYFHIPLCSYICHFCNYVKKLLPANSKDFDSQLDFWCDYLIKESELNLRKSLWLKDIIVTSFYIGGGTASLLKQKHLSKIINHVKGNYNVSESCEFNLEGNPDNFQNEELSEALELGFNRFSVGVQSLQNEVNQFAGRKHDPIMSLNAIEKLNATKKPYNVDMMFGLPYQNKVSVLNDIQTLIEHDVPTITIYRLRNADRQKMGIGNTAIWNVEKINNKLKSDGLFPSLVETYEMREDVMNLLLEASYLPSPCGWWSKKNTYPNGNIPLVSKNKWQNYDSMIAYGPGAYGWLTFSPNNILQTHNTIDINGYAKIMVSENPEPFAFGRQLNYNESFCFKSRQLIEFNRFEKQFNINIQKDCLISDVFSELISKGFVEENRNGFLPTILGEAFHEEIISVFIHNRIGKFNTQICNR